MREDPHPTESVDLDNCDREPIHLLGQVQSYGGLIAMTPDWVVQHVSANLDTILGIDPHSLVGEPLTDHLSAEVVQNLNARMDLLGQEQDSIRVFGVQIGGRATDLSLHLSGKLVVLEVEPRKDDRDLEEVSLIHPLLRRVRAAPHVENAAQEAAHAIRALTDFGRIMVYRFDDEGSGTVIAEAAVPGVDSFLGLRFPASDIPQQARALYTRNPMRLIADVDAQTHPILSATMGSGDPLDLSMSVTRAVSPIHLEYLRNMGVRASMSVSIIDKGKLWGLFACHNLDGPKPIGLERRTAIEIFAQLFSYELLQKEADQVLARSTEARNLHDAMIARAGQGADFTENVDILSQEISGAIDFDGIAVLSDGAYIARGHAPSETEFVGLVDDLIATAPGKIFSTHRLFDKYPAARGFSHPAAGILALPLSRSPRDYIVLFRREVVETVHWAGKPEKKMETGPLGPRLTPRSSFQAWQQQVEGKSARWTKAELAVAESVRATLLEVVLKITDEANRQRQRASETQALLIAELNHRVRNILNLIRGLVRQTRDTSGSPENFAMVLDGRIEALARAHDQLTQTDWSASSVHKLIDVEFAAYGGSERIVITGPDLALVPDAYATLALVLHELVTNSAKYGALSVPEGHVAMTFEIDDGGAFILTWTDRNGPDVSPPTRKGFGTTIIEKSVPFELGGEAELTFPSAGMSARFVIPARHVGDITDVQIPEMTSTDGDKATATVARPEGIEGRVLLVEDNMVIALDAADILEGEGAEEVLVAATAQQAMELLDANIIDLAILDINLGRSASSLTVAEALVERGTPFLLATGYGESTGAANGFPPAPVLKKPYSAADLIAAVGKLRTVSAD